MVRTTHPVAEDLPLLPPTPCHQPHEPQHLAGARNSPDAPVLAGDLRYGLALPVLSSMRCRRQRSSVRWLRPCRSPHHLVWQSTTRSCFITPTSSLCVCCLVRSWPGWHL